MAARCYRSRHWPPVYPYISICNRCRAKPGPNVTDQDRGDFRSVQTKSLGLPAISNMWPIMLLWLRYILRSHLIRRPPGPLIPIAILARKQSKEVSVAAETPCSVLYNDIRSFGGLKHLEIARMLINGNSYLAVPAREMFFQPLVSHPLHRPSQA